MIRDLLIELAKRLSRYLEAQFTRQQQGGTQAVAAATLADALSELNDIILSIWKEFRKELGERWARQQERTTLLLKLALLRLMNLWSRKKRLVASLIAVFVGTAMAVVGPFFWPVPLPPPPVIKGPGEISRTKPTTNDDCPSGKLDAQGSCVVEEEARKNNPISRELRAPGDPSRPENPDIVGKDREIVNILYDERKLTDATRAQLIEIFVEASPIEVWPLVGIPIGPVNYEALIQAKFGISEASPQSFAALKRAILAGNPELKEQENRSAQEPPANESKERRFIRIPPVPPRANGMTSKFIRFAALDNILHTARNIHDIDAKKPPSRALSNGRAGAVTAKEIPNAHFLAERAWATGRDVLPKNAYAVSNRGLVLLYLLRRDEGTKKQDGGGKISGDSAAGGCDIPDDWAITSGYYDKMTARLATLRATPATFDALLKKAGEVPLVVLDWTSGTNMHGREVEGVAKYVMKKVGIPELADQKSIKFVDLNPRNDGPFLSTVLASFEKDYFCIYIAKCDPLTRHPLFVRSEQWIANPPTQTGNKIDVDQFVLESLLWYYFRANRSWVNMSFSVDNEAIQVNHPKFLSTSSSFGIAAAHDIANVQESPLSVPQQAAGTYPNFVNVTYGTHQGEILGSVSSQDYNVIVTLLAPGCGFDFDASVKGDAGSSLASPYVAAFSWLEFLLDGIDQDHMRKALIKASWLPQTGTRLPIESEGVFDAPTLIASDQARLTIRSPQVAGAKPGVHTVGLKSGVLTLHFLTQGGEATYPYAVGSGYSIALVRSNGKIIARVRRFRDNLRPPIPIAEAAEADGAEVVSIEFSAVPGDGSQPIRETDKEQFADKVVEVVF